ncbi:pupal cuticle protein [Haematobia irritans]|uniref:pupal cuticle protein n=1 Tax=Haematobia irritans TaxID=7368 RepID=UPI003F508044
MKAICVILLGTLALTAAYSARPQYYNNMAAASNNQYTKSSASSSSYSSHGSEKDAQIVHKDSHINDDGSYHYEFETSNGIKHAQQGASDGSVQGSSSYISPEGIEIKTTYVADETGYHPVGDHIPKIPDYILRALEYIRNHPYVEKDYYTGELKQATFNNVRRVAAPHHQPHYNVF